MEVDHPEQITTSDETAMRERLMEKVLARNGPMKEESVEMMDTDKEKYWFLWKLKLSGYYAYLIIFSSLFLSQV